MNAAAYPTALSTQSAALGRTLAINGGRAPSPAGVATDPAAAGRDTDRATTVNLSGLFAKLRSSLASRGPSPFAGVQREVDGIAASIRSVLNSSNAGGPSNVGVVNVASAVVSNYQFGNVNLDPGERLDVEVTVVNSAERGALYLSMGGWSQTIVPQGDSANFDITGSKGTVSIELLSGMSVAQVAAVINARTAETGVVASAAVGFGRAGVYLLSTKYGNDEFVGVRATNSGNISPFGVGGTGVFEIDFRYNRNSQELEPRIDRDSWTFYSSPVPRIDRGEDIFALVNGQYTAGIGTSLFFQTPEFSGVIDLAARGPSGRPTQALIGGRFTAMTLIGGTGGGLGGIVDQGGSGGKPGTSPSGIASTRIDRRA